MANFTPNADGLKKNGFLQTKHLHQHAASHKHQVNAQNNKQPRLLAVNPAFTRTTTWPCDAENTAKSPVQHADCQEAERFVDTSVRDSPCSATNDGPEPEAFASNINDERDSVGWLSDDEETAWVTGQRGASGDKMRGGEASESEGEPESESEELESDDDELGGAVEADSAPDLFALGAGSDNATRTKASEAQLGDEFYPYPTQGIAMADVSFNGPRARFSRTQKIAALEMSRHLCGKKKAPTLHALTQAQIVLEKKLGEPTHRRTTQAGTVWYENDISNSIAKDISNPITRQDMQMYPHLECDGQRVTQVWHGAKMLYSVPDEQMTPMIRTNDNRIFYVNELVKLSDGKLFIPRRWFLRGELKEKWCFGDYVHSTPDGAVIERSSLALRPSVAVSTFTHTYSELMRSEELFEGFADGFEADLALMPHPLRTIADDVSGGVSKQWNKYIACYMSNAAIPREALQKELNVRYVGATNQMSASELLSGIASSIKHAFANPTVTFDALTKREVLVRPYALMWPGDNPMQAEACSCGSLKSNFMCRTCHAGGTQEFKRSDEGYQSLIQEGVIRDPRQTLETVQARFALALQPGARSKVDDDMALTGVKDGIGQPIIENLVTLGIKLRKVSADNPSPKADNVSKVLLAHLETAKEKGAINALLEMDGVNIHEDTPTEILHTVLLGVVKYFWAQSFHIIKQDHHMDTFQTRLRSLNSKGLGIPSILADYMCNYSGTLIGKHFKTLAQVMPFVVHGLVPQCVQDAWLLLGRLVVLLWVTEIDMLDSYLIELKDVIDMFLVTAAICSPGILMEKPKFHFLVHLPRFIQRFGPAILFSTERYESYHAIFRAAMVKSNRQAPSRDAAKAIASIDRVQHICMGGYWRKADGSGWEQASLALLQFMRKSKVFSKILGIYQYLDPTPGTVTMVARTKSKGKTHVTSAVPWLSTLTSKTGVPFVEPGGSDIGATYQSIKQVIARTGDTITAGSHSIIQVGATTSFCTVVELLLRQSKSSPTPSGVFFATVRPMHLGAGNHVAFDMPTLTSTNSIRLVEFVDLICTVNLQHDCVGSGCNEVELLSVMQEREVSARQQRFVKHKDSTHFILNTQALHNHKHILAALPVELQKRAYTISDVQAHMTSAALSLRKTHNKKTAARKAALKRAKEEKALEAVTTVNVVVKDEDEEILDFPKPSREAKTSPKTASLSGSLSVPTAGNPAQPIASSSGPSLSHLPGIEPPTKKELDAMRTELSLKRKREPDAIDLNDGMADEETDERAKKRHAAQRLQDELHRKKMHAAESSRRTIKHPNFHNFNSTQAHNYLANQHRGDVVIRPSSKGPTHLAVTWKVDEGVYQHIDVVDPSGNPGEQNVGKQLIIDGKYEYSDLDELIVNHVNAMARKVEELIAHEKYKAGSEAELHKALKEYLIMHPTKSIYAFALNRQKPGYFNLSFLANKNAPIRTWPVRVIPEGYVLIDTAVPTVPDLCNAFKMRYSTPQTGTARTPAYGAGRMTPGGACTPGHCTPGHATGGKTPNPYAGGKTPNPYAATQTPNPYAPPARAQQAGSWGTPPAPPGMNPERARMLNSANGGGDGGSGWGNLNNASNNQSGGWGGAGAGSGGGWGNSGW
ncbi:hypothetical protein FRC06_006616 [Ceratobasidium sp. 370]|nr:hypothetical protein FRC06_006616 [Ceratobasidium sp. 370]